MNPLGNIVHTNCASLMPGEKAVGIRDITRVGDAAVVDGTTRADIIRKVDDGVVRVRRAKPPIFLDEI